MKDELFSKKIGGGLISAGIGFLIGGLPGAILGVFIGAAIGDQIERNERSSRL